MKKITKMKNWLPALLLLLTVFLIAQDENRSKSNPGSGSWRCITDITVGPGSGPADKTVCINAENLGFTASSLSEEVNQSFTDGDKRFTSSGGVVLFESCVVPFAKSYLDWSLELPSGQSMSTILQAAGDYTLTLKGTPSAEAVEEIAPCTAPSVEYTFTLTVSETRINFTNAPTTAAIGQAFTLTAEDDNCPDSDISMTVESVTDGQNSISNFGSYVTLSQSSTSSTTATYSVTLLKECTVVIKAFKAGDENESVQTTINSTGCEECTSNCTTESSADLQSLRYKLTLGKNGGTLLIHEQKPSVLLSTPSAIEYDFYHRNVEKINRSNQLRQILTEKYLMDLTTVDAYEYDVKLYLVAGLAAKVNGLYPTTGLTLAKHLNVKSPEKSPDNKHIVFTTEDFTGTSGQHIEVSDFTYNSTDNSWTLKEIDGITGKALKVEKLVKDQKTLTVNPLYSVTTAIGDQDLLLRGQTFTPEKATVDKDYISELVKLKTITFTTGVTGIHSPSPVSVKVYSSVNIQNEKTLVATSTNALDISSNNTAYTWNFNSDTLNKADVYIATFTQNGKPLDLTLRAAKDNYTGGKALDTNETFSFDATCTVTFESDANNIIDSESNIRTIIEADNTIVAVTRETWKTYPFGRRQLSEVRDPNGRQLTRTWEYYSDKLNDRGAYSKLKKQKSIDGSYKSYTYTADGDVDTEVSFNSLNQQISFASYTYDNLFRVIKKVESFDRSTSDQGESAHRVTRYDYTPFHSIDDGTVKPYSPRQTIVSIKDQEFSRTYNAYQLGEERQFVCQTTGAAYNADDTLVTVTKTVTTPHFRDRVLSVARPGNLGINTTYLYDEETDTETITKESGAATFDSEWNVTVTDGSSTRTINVNELPQSIVTTDILSGLIIGSQVHTYDEYDRIIRTDFLNGTFSKKEYACCGLRSETDIDGAKRIYHTNALKQRFSTTVSGITTKNIFNAQGRIVETQRYPESDPTDIIITSQTIYNLAGEIVSRENKGVITTFATKYNNGSTVKVATKANGATQVTRTNAWRDTDVSGTAVYSFLQSNRSDIEMLEGKPCLVNTYFTSKSINNAGTLVNRWKKTWRNSLGITIKAENSAGHITRTYTDELGRVNKTVALDGLISLYTYNARGQKEKQVLDYDRDSVIDLDGLDQVSQTQSKVLKVNGQTVFRTTQKSWNTDNSDVATIVNVSDQVLSAASGDTIKLTQSSTSFGLTSTRETILNPKTKTRRLRDIKPDGTYSETIIIDGKAQSNSSYAVDDSLISQTTFTYDSHGRQKSQTQSGFGTTDISYFDDDLTKTVTRPLKAGQARQVESYVYNAIGQRTEIHRADGSVVLTKFNLKNELIEESGAGKNPRVYTYEEAKPKTVTSYKNFAAKTSPAVTTYIYDRKTQQKISTILPNGDTTRTTYEYSRPKTITNGRGQVSTYSYNNAGRLKAISYSENTMAPRHWVYDRLGRPSTLSGPQGLRTFAYTAEGQLDTQTHNGLVTDYDQDVLLRPVASHLRQNGQSLRSVTWSYDSNDGRQKTISANGIDINLAYNDKGFHSYTYNNGAADFMKKEVNRDNLGNINDIVYSKQDGTVSNSFSYTYNQLNLPSRFTQTNGEYWQYAYDTQDGLKKAQKYNTDTTAKNGYQYGYSRNDAGDRTQKTFNGNKANYKVALNGQIESITDPNEQKKSYTYDADGNTLTDSKWNYTYNQINQLVSMETKLNIYVTVSPKKIDFSYDIFGNRVLKTVSTRSAQTEAWAVQTSLAFVYKGAQVIAEFDKLNDDKLKKTLVYGPYIDEVLIQTNYDAGKSTNFYPQVDRQFSVRTLVDETCNIVESYDYSPFGKMSIYDKNGGALIETDYANYIGYTGRRLDAESGLWYFRARYYSDELGRFINRDPLEYVDGMSLYAGYFAQRFGLDPSGEFTIWGVTATNIKFPGFITKQTFFSCTCYFAAEFKIVAKVTVNKTFKGEDGAIYNREAKNIKRTEVHEAKHKKAFDELNDTLQALYNTLPKTGSGNKECQKLKESLANFRTVVDKEYNKVVARQKAHTDFKGEIIYHVKGNKEVPSGVTY
jgi:RHS repeat-associated protein